MNKQRFLGSEKLRKTLAQYSCEYVVITQSENVAVTANGHWAYFRGERNVQILDCSFDCTTVTIIKCAKLYTTKLQPT